MTKQQAIQIFGNTQVALANAVGRSKQAIFQWPDVLTKDQQRIVLGAALMEGKRIPKELIKNF